MKLTSPNASSEEETEELPIVRSMFFWGELTIVKGM
jgi:hypothetical protein